MRKLFKKNNSNSFSSKSYWEKRYKSGRSSGAGSYGRLAKFKAKTINDFVKEKAINTVLEIGVGDGNQLTLAEYPNYVGVDVSQEAINLCKEKFQNDQSKQFVLADKGSLPKAELVLSLDVIFHLVEDSVFEKYMKQLFDCALLHVIIYSSNKRNLGDTAEHVKHRVFTNWIEINAPKWKLLTKLDNKYPFDSRNPDETSFADFYIYQKTT